MLGDISELALARADDAGRRLADAVEAVDDVLGRHRHPVVEDDAAAKPERDRLAVGRNLPFFGEVRLKLGVVAAVDPQQRRVARRTEKLREIRDGLVDIEIGRIAAVADPQRPPRFGLCDQPVSGTITTAVKAPPALRTVRLVQMS